jgi:hypothetical protein
VQELGVIRRVGSALLAVAVALLVGGCGESSIGAVSMSKEEFVRHADFICAKADFDQPNEREAFMARYEDDLKGVAAVPYEETMAVDLIIPSVKRQIRELEALEPPASERKELETLLAGWNKAVREGEKDPYSIANFWVPAQDPLAKINKVATRYGFESCSELR